MNYSNHIASIAELSESEGVFTTAQAKRVGVTRDALHDAVESGRLQRVMRELIAWLDRDHPTPMSL